MGNVKTEKSDHYFSYSDLFFHLDFHRPNPPTLLPAQTQKRDQIMHIDWVALTDVVVIAKECATFLHKEWMQNRDECSDHTASPYFDLEKSLQF